MESAVYNIYKSGDNGDPCGVPLIRLNGHDRTFSISIAAVRLFKNEIMYLIMYCGRRRSFSL